MVECVGFMERRAELGNLNEVRQSPPKRGFSFIGSARFLAALLVAGLASTASAQETNVIEDDGRFPQCTNVRLADRDILFTDPLNAELPFARFNPQIRRTILTLYQNGIHDIVDIQLLPQQTRFRMSGSSVRTYCLPDFVNGISRPFIKTGEGMGLGLPGGGSENIVELELPKGINPIEVTRFAPNYLGGQPQLRRWLVSMVEPNENITVRNSDGSLTMTGKGPLAMPIEGWEGNWNIEYILPERGFADDKSPVF